MRARSGRTPTSCSTATSPPDRSAARILALGDSYTIGESVAADASWPLRLAAALRAGGRDVSPPRVVARTGWTTDELALAIDAAQVDGPYDLVTLLVGVNDQFRGRPVGDFGPRFRELVERAVRFAGGRADRVIVLSIPDWSITPFAEGRDRDRIAAELDVFNESVRNEAKRAGVRYVDVTPISRRAGREPDLIAPDGLHPSGRMYTAWVEAVLPLARAAIE
ncbi:MAG TPA: SGNH/GDSL hydrolase family protein [Gemmatimonadaceae bacterium]|nr:SGNH/GDSL hydrolase family protein [Gemmatimonadaceae bacterium]